MYMKVRFVDRQRIDRPRENHPGTDSPTLDVHVVHLGDARTTSPCPDPGSVAGALLGHGKQFHDVQLCHRLWLWLMAANGGLDNAVRRLSVSRDSFQKFIPLPYERPREHRQISRIREPRSINAENFRVIEALNMASITFLSVASYFPEYVRARVSAGLMFTMMDRTPKIDNLSESGNRDVRSSVVAISLT
jgi:hypothetical protein